MGFLVNMFLNSVMENLLSIENLSKSYNGLQVVKNVSFSVCEGKITALIGENGAGKTTLFNLITGVEKQDEGKIFFEGKEIDKLSAVKRSRAGVERMFQSPRVFKNQNVIDNLLAGVHGHPGESIVNYLIKPKAIKIAEQENREKAIKILHTLQLQDYKNEMAGTLSYGQKKLLALGQLLMNNAKLILLDEPFSGLYPSMVYKIKEILINLTKEGKTFIIIEHKVKMLKKMSDHVLKMREGTIIEDKQIN